MQKEVMVFKCDRCGQKKTGATIIGYGTEGFYDLTSSPWFKFAKNSSEKIICDSCMYTDPEYIKRYGIR